METIEKYKDCKKEEVTRKVPEDLWCGWLAQASDGDRADEAFMKKLVLRRGECLKFSPDPLRSDQSTVLKIVKNCPSAIRVKRSALSYTYSATRQNSAV